MKHIKVLIFFFLAFYSSIVTSQKYTIKKIDSMNVLAYDLLHKDSKKALSISENAYLQSRKNNYEFGEIVSINNLAYIYYTIGDMKKAIEYATLTERRALNANEYFYVCSALKIKGGAYSQLGFFDESRKTIHKGLGFSDKIKDQDQAHAIKSELYQALTVVLFHEDEKAKDSLLLLNKIILKEVSKIKSTKNRDSRLAVAYLNLADSYTDFHILDSAELYLNRALKITKRSNDVFIELNVTSNLGRLFYEKKEYQKAICYYNQSNEKAIIYKEPYIKRGNFKGLQNCYRALKDQKKEQEFLLKYLDINDSINAIEKASVITPVNQIINEREEHFINQRYRLYIILIVVILISLFVWYFGYKSNKRYRLEKADKLNKEAIIFEKNSQLNELKLQVDDSFCKIIELAKHDDPLFVTLFKELYPVFYMRLYEIQHDLTLQELKICFYLKLKFSTKEIAEYTFVTIKAIQNRKNRLRKRLGIHNDEDIYSWMENLDRN